MAELGGTGSTHNPRLREWDSGHWEAGLLGLKSMVLYYASHYSMEYSSKFQSSQGIVHKGTQVGQCRLFLARGKWTLNALLLSPNFCDHSTFWKHITSRELYSFPSAAVTNYHHLSGFRQHTFIRVHFHKSEVQNQFHWAKTNVSAGPPSLRRFSGSICLLAPPGI